MRSTSRSADSRRSGAGPAHDVGDVIEGVVTKHVPFGSFVESEGFTGLAHQQSWPVGTRVSVRILAIDSENQRFSLAAA